MSRSIYVGGGPRKFVWRVVRANFVPGGAIARTPLADSSEA